MPREPGRVEVAERVVLVGESNPYSGDDQRFALYPSPEGSAGWRLCVLILGMRRLDYLRSFERANLCGRDWRAREARERAESLLHRRLVLLGAKVCSAFAVPYHPMEVGTTLGESGNALVLPHPSGRCRAWNEAGSIARARAAVAAHAPEVAWLLGAADVE